MAGQSVMDRVQAVRHSLAGQGLAKSVCKATTEEIMGPKKKHLDYLVNCTNEPNVSIPNLANLLIDRTSHASWVVVFKSLVTIHNIMNFGNERFTQYLASNNCTFNLSNFLDKAAAQGYDMSTFVRRYAKYLSEKCVSYRHMAFDFCKVKRGKDDGLLRKMATEKLLKSLPVLQGQIDGLLEFDCSPNELSNGVINAAFMLLFKDLIRLFACYNDGIINLLEKYFEMNKKQCKQALDIYKKFVARMDNVAKFLKTAENMGIDKGEIPDLATAPSSLLEALEQHLASLEGKKGVKITTNSAVVSSAISTMTSNSSNLTIEDKQKLIDEESRHLQQLKAQHSKDSDPPSMTVAPTTVPQAAKPNNPVNSGASNDLIGLDASANPFGGVDDQSPPQRTTAGTVNVMNSYGGCTSIPQTLSTDDHFAAVFGQTVRSPSSEYLNETGVTAAAKPAPSSSPATLPTTSPVNAPSSVPAPLLDAAAVSVTSSAPLPSSIDLLAGMDFMANSSIIQQTQPAPIMAQPQQKSMAAFDSFGGNVMQPQQQSTSPVGAVSQSTITPQQKLIGGDLDSSLVSLAGNLNINGPRMQVGNTNALKKTEHNWTAASGQNKQLTGRAMQQQPFMPSFQQPNTNMMGQGGNIMSNGMQPHIAGMYGQPQMFPAATPNIYNNGPAAMNYQQANGVSWPGPQMQNPQNPMMMGQPRQMAPPNYQQAQQRQNVNDPFGAL